MSKTALNRFEFFRPVAHRVPISRKLGAGARSALVPGTVSGDAELQLPAPCKLSEFFGNVHGSVVFESGRVSSSNTSTTK